VRVLIGCEQFGHTREAFRRRGHYAYLCDLKPARNDSPFHLLGDVRRWLELAPDGEPWDAAIFHPDCTYFTNSAAWAYCDPDFDRYPGGGLIITKGSSRELWWEPPGARLAKEMRISFASSATARSPAKPLRTPRGYLSAVLGPGSQKIQPNEYGEDASKATCLWLFRLPLLEPWQMRQAKAGRC
jgi:hypothetical protein